MLAPPPQAAEREYARKMLEELRAKERAAAEKLRIENEAAAAAAAAAAPPARELGDSDDEEQWEGRKGGLSRKGSGLLSKLGAKLRSSEHDVDGVAAAAAEQDGSGKKGGARLLGKLRLRSRAGLITSAAVPAAATAAAAAAHCAPAPPPMLPDHPSVVEYGWYGGAAPHGALDRLAVVAAALELQTASPGARGRCALCYLCVLLVCAARLCCWRGMASGTRSLPHRVCTLSTPPVLPPFCCPCRLYARAPVWRACARARRHAAAGL